MKTTKITPRGHGMDSDILAYPCRGEKLTGEYALSTVGCDPKDTGAMLQ